MLCGTFNLCFFVDLKALSFLVVAPQGTGDDTTRSKDASLCLLLGCCKPKCQNLKKGSFFDYCGKTHAHEAKERKLIVPG